MGVVVASSVTAVTAAAVNLSQVAEATTTAGAAVAMGMDGALCKRLQTGWGASRADRELGVDAFGERLLHATLSGGKSQSGGGGECSELLLRSVGLLCAAQGWEWAYASWLTPTLWPLLFDPDSYV
eukprot:COSAG01_NODE_29455_length_637_cov_0.789963_1_plen_125_part_10